MEKKLLSLVVAAGLLLCGLTETVYAGVEPSPFQPEINKLHSIKLNMAFIQIALPPQPIFLQLLGIPGKQHPAKLRNVLAGVIYIDDLNRLRKPQLSNVPHPQCPIGQQHNLAGLIQPSA